MTDSATRVAWRIRTRRGDEGGVDREASTQTTTGVSRPWPGEGRPRRAAVASEPSPAAVYTRRMSRIFQTAVAAVYPLYLAKLERKGRTREELDEVIAWLTGFDGAALARHLDSGSTFEQFFADARLNPAADRITGRICGVRVEEIDDPLMRRIRCLDKLVDELYRGRPMSAVLRD